MRSFCFGRSCRHDTPDVRDCLCGRREADRPDAGGDHRRSRHSRSASPSRMRAKSSAKPAIRKTNGIVCSSTRSSRCTSTNSRACTARRARRRRPGYSCGRLKRLRSRISARDGRTSRPERRWPRSMTFSQDRASQVRAPRPTPPVRAPDRASAAPISLPIASAAAASSGNASRLGKLRPEHQPRESGPPAPRSAYRRRRSWRSVGLDVRRRRCGATISSRSSANLRAPVRPAALRDWGNGDRARHG